MTTAPRFDEFTEASRLTRLDAASFAAATQRWEDPASSLTAFDQPAAETPLPTPTGRLHRLLRYRRSSRTFADTPISTTDLAGLLAVTGVDPAGRPLVPAAGGLDPLATYAFVLRGHGQFDGAILRYRAATHSVARVGDVPDESACRLLFGLACEGMPAVVFAFAIDPTTTLAKYGERGGRFLFQQVGHACANVGLHVAASEHRRRSGLNGFILGGVLDEVTGLVGLSHTPASVVGGYAVGVTGRRRRFGQPSSVQVSA